MNILILRGTGFIVCPAGRSWEKWLKVLSWCTKSPAGPEHCLLGTCALLIPMEDRIKMSHCKSSKHTGEGPRWGCAPNRPFKGTESQTQAGPWHSVKWHQYRKDFLSDGNQMTPTPSLLLSSCLEDIMRQNGKTALQFPWFGNPFLYSLSLKVFLFFKECLLWAPGLWYCILLNSKWWCLPTVAHISNLPPAYPQISAPAFPDPQPLLSITGCGSLCALEAHIVVTVSFVYVSSTASSAFAYHILRTKHITWYIFVQ